MPLETEVLAPPSSSQAAGATPAAPLDMLMQSIAGDAALESGEYLRDTEVPHGGE
jgi:hypothetical protein